MPGNPAAMPSNVASSGRLFGARKQKWLNIMSRNQQVAILDHRMRRESRPGASPGFASFQN
jgi:hypothetical protein